MKIVPLLNIQNIMFAKINPRHIEKFVIIEIVFLEAGSINSTTYAYEQIALAPLKNPNINKAK